MSVMKSALPIVTVVLLVSCSYPLDPDVGRNEVFAHANRIERILPPGWKIFKDYNSHGYGMVIIRTQDDAQFHLMPFGRKGYLELVIFLSGSPRIALPKITEAEFNKKESTRRKLIARQRQLYKSIYPQASEPVSYIEYIPVTVEKEVEITEYNRLVDELRINEEQFPRYYTSNFGVEFIYPEPYQIGGVPEQLKTEYLEMIESVKRVFSQYKYHGP